MASMTASSSAGSERSIRVVVRVRPPEDPGDNFYQLLQEAKDILPDNSWWK